jgi:hypothetical protein
VASGPRVFGAFVMTVRGLVAVYAVDARSPISDDSPESLLNAQVDSIAAAAHHHPMLSVPWPRWCMNESTFWSARSGHIETDIKLTIKRAHNRCRRDKLSDTARYRIDTDVNHCEPHTPPWYTYVRTPYAYSMQIQWQARAPQLVPISTVTTAISSTN